MWVFTQIGFFSVVQDGQDGSRVIVRGRSRRDMDKLAEFAAGTLGIDPPAVTETPNSDYGYRITDMTKAAWGKVISRLCEEINYPTFKQRVDELYRGNWARREAYHDIWGIMYDLQDLGNQGQWPTHPELLDWLAVEFMDSGWNVKHMVKLIVTSKTYQQSANPSPELLESDPYNELYARQNARRLPAEFIRDNALAISGLLNDQVGRGLGEARAQEVAARSAALHRSRRPGEAWTRMVRSLSGDARRLESHGQEERQSEGRRQEVGRLSDRGPRTRPGPAHEGPLRR